MSAWDIPLFDLDYGDAEIAAATEVFRSQWLTMGERIKTFEAEFAELCDVPHAIAMNNCTAALHASYLACGVKSGDEVIVPSLTFVAAVNTVVAAGARPVFADITSPTDFSISAASVEKAITKRTRAVSVLHFGGFPCDIEALCDLAQRRGLAIIEDCAHAPGSSHAGRPAGSWGDAGAFSFFSNKNLSTGEGGMVVTRRDDIAAKLRLLRSHGMTSATLDRHKGHSFTYDVVLAGYNYRMDEVHAALGSVQLAKLAGKNEKRRLLTEHYRRSICSTLPGLIVPFGDAPTSDSACHIFVVLLPEGSDRPSVMKKLAAERIQSSVHYQPVHRFSYYRESFPGVSLAVTDSIADRIVTLPLFPTMTTDQVDRVVDVLAASI
ncbi:MAG TPA: DegT/DnrJ/EryC1/StrS family aminotransferase [Gemmatimonadaceae bacterium]|nr:DegT/DnrJ/EryC1/StrS family aminotransferase [Gemmatimonadaceae bacterium]